MDTITDDRLSASRSVEIRKECSQGTEPPVCKRRYAEGREGHSVNSVANDDAWLTEDTDAAEG